MGLLHDCEIFADGLFAALLLTVSPGRSEAPSIYQLCPRQIIGFKSDCAGPGDAQP